MVLTSEQWGGPHGPQATPRSPSRRSITAPWVGPEISRPAGATTGVERLPRAPRCDGSASLLRRARWHDLITSMRGHLLLGLLAFAAYAAETSPGRIVDDVKCAADSSQG